MKRSLILAAAVLILTAGITAQLQAREKKCPVRFAVLGDRTGGHVPGVFGSVIAEVQHLRPDFVMTVGDFIEGYTGDTVVINKQWQEFKGLLEPLTMDVYFVPGNHDIWDTVSMAYYKRYLGKPHYSFDIDDIHFVIVDNSLYYDDSVFVRQEEGQIGWLIDDLKNNQDARYTIVFFHIPYWIETRAKGKNDTLHNIFVEYGIDAVFTGHYHQYFTGEFDGISYTGVGSSGGVTGPGPTGLMFHYVWVTVDDDGITITPIKKDAVLPWDEVTADEFHLVNKIKRKAVLFEGAAVKNLNVPKTKIKVSIDNFNQDLTMKDTITWDVPEGWRVEPVQQSLEIAGGAQESVEFTVEGYGVLYPTPTLRIDYPYAPDKTFELEKSLKISRVAYAIKVDSPPLIDGKLTEIFWRRSEDKFFSPDGTPVKGDPVSFYFAWDKDNLYLAAKCVEKKMDELVAAASEHDAAVWGEDCVGYFFQPDIEDGPVYQIYFNAAGTVFDQEIKVEDGIAVDADREWDGSYEVATDKGEHHWSIEVKIPLAQLNTEGKKGKVWMLNFRRKQKRLDTAADWMVPIGYNPADYGRLEMRLIK